MNLRIKQTSLRLITYGIAVFLYGLGHTSVLAPIPEFSRLIKIFLYGICFFCLLLIAKEVALFTLKELLVVIGLFFLLGYNILVNGASHELLYILFFMALCRECNPEDVLYVYAICTMSIVILTLILWKIGFLSNVVAKNRKPCLGFAYSTFGPNLLFHAVVAYVASKKDKIAIWKWMGILYLNFYLYQRADTLAAFALVNVLCILYFVCRIKLIQKFIFKSKIIKGCLSLFPVLCTITTFCGQYLYSRNSQSPFWIAANMALSQRLQLGRIAFDRYPISLFGQPIKWQTHLTETIENYFYVDSSYLQILLQHGIIMLCIILTLMMIVEYYGVIEKKANFILALNVFLIHCITDPQLLSFRYNAFLVVSLSCIMSTKTMWKYRRESYMEEKNVSIC